MCVYEDYYIKNFLSPLYSLLNLPYCNLHTTYNIICKTIIEPYAKHQHASKCEVKESKNNNNCQLEILNLNFIQKM